MGRNKKYTTPEELQSLIDEYFHLCDTTQEEFSTKDGELYTKTVPKPYTIEGLAAHLEVDRATILDYEKLPTHKDYHNTIKKAKTKILANLKERGLSGKNNPAVTIFNLLNNYGYKNKTEDSESADKTVNINIKYPNQD